MAFQYVKPVGKNMSREKIHPVTPQNEPLWAIAEALGKLAAAVDRLGMNRNGEGMGVLEFFAVEMRDGVRDVAEAIRESKHE